MPESVDLGYAASLRPERAIAYFQERGYALTWSWRDMSEEAHALAFTVAKSAGYNVLKDIRVALANALAEGQTYRTFAQGLEPALRRKGWWGRVTDPETGESALLGSPRRLKTIFRTNLRTAYAASRFEAMKDNVSHRPFWMYDAMDDSLTRPSHAALDGKVFRHDDPFWESHYPPNGFNCRCLVRALTRREVEMRGLEVLSSEGRMNRVDQDFGARQTTTQGYHDPDSDEILIPDPGFGRRPLPGLVSEQTLVASMRAAFDAPLDNAILAGRRFHQQIVSSADPRAALLGLIREHRGPGLQATNVRAATRGPKARRLAREIREFSELLPADWVRRANMAPGVTVKPGGRRSGAAGSYSPWAKEITININGERTGVLLHEYVHFLQEMHPDLDNLFWAFHRRRHRHNYSFRTYASREYNYAYNDQLSMGTTAGAAEARQRASKVANRGLGATYKAGGLPLEVFTTTMQALLAGDPPGSMKVMYERDRELFDFVVGLLLGYAGP